MDLMHTAKRIIAELAQALSVPFDGSFSQVDRHRIFDQRIRRRSSIPSYAARRSVLNCRAIKSLTTSAARSV